MYFDIARALVAWYKENKRELPWRETTNPYLIWVSEIILQQTRVVQGLDYFNRFVARFPDVRALAEAEEDEVLKYWQGLGYYSRARNLHKAAQEIMRRFCGRFPDNYPDVLSLKGIGEYTAAAVCSFAWKQPYAVVDGNVYRVLSRLFAIETPINSGAGKKDFALLANELLDKERPDLYNQAIMDFGAMQCLPKSPDCVGCPLRENCMAYGKHEVDKFPVKEGKTVVKPRYFNYLNVRCGNDVLFSQRRGKDIWQNLYEFPLIETVQPEDFGVLQQETVYRELFGDVEEVKIVRTVEMPKHVLSHRIIYARFYEIEVSSFSEEMLNRYIKIDAAKIGDYAVSRLMELYLQL